MSASLRVYAMDVGSTKGSGFGWARATGSADSPQVCGGSNVASMVAAMHADAAEGVVVTLGVEAPLWLPIPADEARLSTGRPGEGSRSTFAPAGGYVALLGLHQLAYVAAKLPTAWQPTLDWKTWARTSSSVLVWEAFVSQTAHAPMDSPSAHTRDAATAAVEFLSRADQLATDVAPDDRPTLSLAGTALLWSGRLRDWALLSAPTLVLRPCNPYTGPIAVS